MPPKIKKYCISCKSIQKFEYDPILGHSKCMKCGWRKIPTTIMITGRFLICKHCINDWDNCLICNWKLGNSYPSKFKGELNGKQKESQI